MKEKLKILVVNNHTIGIQREGSNTLEVLQTLKSKGSPYEGGPLQAPIHIPRNADVRLATEKDFDDLRLTLYPREDSMYEYIYDYPTDEQTMKKEVKFNPIYNSSEDEYIHAKLKFNDSTNEWNASIDGEPTYFKDKDDAIEFLKGAGFTVKEMFGNGGGVSAKNAEDIAKLKKLLDSNLVPDAVKAKAKQKIAELEAEKEVKKPEETKETFAKSKLKGTKELRFKESTKIVEHRDGNEGENFFKIEEGIFGTIIGESSKNYKVKSIHNDKVEYIVPKNVVDVIDVEETKKESGVIGYAIVDPISGDIVASKATLDGLKEAHSQMEKDPDFADLDGIVYTIIKKNGKNVVGEKVEVDWIKSKKTQKSEKATPTPSTGKKRLKDISDYVTRRNIEYVKFKVHGKEYTVASKNIIDGLYIKKDGHATEVRTQFKLGGGISANHVYIANRYIVEAVIKKDGKLLEYKGKDILDGIYVSKDFFGGDIPKMGAPKVTRTQFEEEDYEFGDGGGISSIKSSIATIIEKYKTDSDYYGSDEEEADAEAVHQTLIEEYDYNIYNPKLVGDTQGMNPQEIWEYTLVKVVPKLKRKATSSKPKKNDSDKVDGAKYMDITERLLNGDKSIPPVEITNIIKTLILAGYTDADLTVDAKSGGAYRNKVDKKTEQVLVKFYKFYDGPLKGNKPFQTIYNIIDMNSRMKYNVLSTMKSVNKFGGGGYVRPSATMKTTGIYKFVTKDKEYILEVSMFERENELKDSLQIQNALRGELGSILINNNAWRRLSKGDTVTAKASKSDVQGKLTRIDDLENVRKHLLSK